MVNKLKYYKSNVIGVIAGIVIGLVTPLGLFFSKLLRKPFIPKIYFLTKVLHPVYGALLTDFIILFIAGIVAALISKKQKLLSSVTVGIITPIIGNCINEGCSVGFFELLVSILFFVIYALLGGLFYTKVLSKYIKNKS